MKYSTRFAITLFTTLQLFAPLTASAQPDSGSVRRTMELNQRRVAEQLSTTADPLERSRLVDMIGNIKPSAIVPELQTALANALTRENLVQRDRARRSRNGESLPEQVDAELVLKLVSLVVSLHNPTHMEALAGAVGTGGRAVNAISDYGPAAVPAIIKAMGQDRADYDVEAGGLLALRFILEEHREQLPPEMQQQIRAAALTRLSTRQRFVSTVLGAMDLAIADGSPALRARVTALRDYPEAALVAGYSDSSHFEILRTRAADRLAGKPPLSVRRRNRS